MARFVQMLQRSGVFADQHFMVVPKGGFNLVYLRDAAGCQLVHDARLKVRDVKFDDIERIATEYLRGRALGPDHDDRLLRLRTAMYGGIAQQAKGRLLQVRENGTGIPVLAATQGGSVVQLDVAIMDRKEYTVAFRFLKHTDASRSVVPLTKRTPADAKSWIDRLNWIYGAQANVFFHKFDAEWISLPAPAPQPMSFEYFEKALVGYRQKGADLTCFLVGKYKGAANGSEAAGSYSDLHKACVLDDGPNTGIFDDAPYDSFIGVMAHEFMHFAGGSHHDRGRLLMSRGLETMEFDKQLVVQINAW